MQEFLHRRYGEGKGGRGQEQEAGGRRQEQEQLPVTFA
jgi:hypothetical protein